MPRKNSTTWVVNDLIEAARLNDINEDLDDIYDEGSDRGLAFEAASATPLNIDIPAFRFNVGWTFGEVADTIDFAVTDNATNYVEVDSLGTITNSTVNWTSTKWRIAKVITSWWAITSIENYRSDIIGWELWGGWSLKAITSTTYTEGFLTAMTADSVNYTMTYEHGRLKTVNDGSNTYTATYNSAGRLTWTSFV